MQLAAALRLSKVPRLAVTGAGGKTSTLFWLARELRQTYPTVILTTTTHLGAWQVQGGDAHQIVTDAQDFDLPPGVVVVTGPPRTERRYGGLAEAALERLLERADRQQIPLLVEADGARLLPLKAPAEHEPAIPQFIDHVVVCAGLSGLGQPLTAEWVHRAPQFARLAEMAPGELITPQAVSRVLMHPQGGLKNIPAAARRSLLLTQAASVELQAQAHSIARQVQPAYHGVIVAELSRLPSTQAEACSPVVPQPHIHAVHEAIAGVILAAGGATRFGSLKQLVDWQGQPMLRRVAQTALQAGLAPLVVVTGAGAAQVAQAVAGLPLQVVENPQWQRGQSSSMQAGLNAIPPTCGGVVFLLADQPNVPAALIQALVDAHSQALAPIVAPLVDGQRGNPVLFDPTTFGDLMQVGGDVGGRQIFSKYPLKYVPWHDRGVLLDVDAPSDYEAGRAP